MNRTSILIIIILFGFGVNAQNPGYLGKHVSLQYGYYISNAISNPNYNGNKGLLAFNNQHNLGLEITVSKKLSLGIRGGYGRTGFDYNAKIEISNYNYYDDYYNYYYYYDCKFALNQKGKINFYSIGIYPKIFLRGNISPLGAYIKPEFYMTFMDVNPNDPDLLPIFNNDNYMDFKADFPPSPTYGAFAMSIELGVNKIYFNRFFLDFGVKLSLTTLRYNDEAASNTINYTIPEANYLKIASQDRIFFHNLLGIKAGTGILLF